MKILDAELYEIPSKLFFEEYIYLEGETQERAATKKAFLEGKVENPTLTYPKLTRKFIDDRCVRTFRGTRCDEPDQCLTKDVVYREGNLRLYEAFRHNPQARDLMHFGKFDPSNEEHVNQLRALGVI